MEDYKFVIKNKKFIVFFVLFNAVFLFSYIFAYSPHYTHPDLTEEIAKLFNSKNSNQDLKISQNEIQWMRQGAINEDTPPRWINHFYDPENKVGWQGKHFGDRTQEQGLYSGESMAPKPAIASIDWVTNQEYQSAYGRQYGNQTWQKAIQAYIDGDRKPAFIALGHILHLVEDLSVPDHTRNDTHADLYGDPGSPYEKYSKEYTNFNKLNIAENLKSKELYNFSTIQDAFEYLANYSNNNFFSEDTISNKEFGLPNLEKLENRIENINNEKALFLYHQQKQAYLAVLKEDKKYSTNDKSFILPSYFSNLAPQAVLTGTSVLDLFFREVEKYKNNPELLPKIIQDSNEATLSYLKKSPRLAVVSTWDSIDKASTNTKIYFAAFSSFFGNFSNLIPAQLAGLISTNAQQEGQGMTQTTPQPLPEPTVQPVIVQLSGIVDTNPIAYEVPIVPIVEATSAQDIAQDVPTVLPTVPSVEVVENPAIVSEVVIDAPTYHGSGSVTGVSPDAVAVISPAEEPQTPLSFSEASTTTDATATSTEEVIAIATSTEPVIIAEPEIIDGPPIVINEIAWMGTKAQANDEWIELYNKTSADIDLSGWILESKNKQLSISLSGIIAAKEYFLLERTASTTTDRVENMVFTGALVNDGPDASLYLKNGTTTIDSIGFNRWIAGENGAIRRTMERVSPYATSTNSYNWKTYAEVRMPPFAKDARGNDIFGTPGAQNSVAGIYTPAWSITEDTIWKKKHSPYYVPPHMIEVKNGATLTIEPGVVVKFAKGMPYGGGMDVYGVLRAEGTATEPIIFTSVFDDAVDGIDSGIDGSVVAPASADWMSVNFYNTATSSVVRHARVRYGGQGVNANPNGWYPAYKGVFSARGTRPEITDSVFEQNHGTALFAENGAHPALTRNVIRNTILPQYYKEGQGGFGIYIADASSTADIMSNTFENNGVGIVSRSATSSPLTVKNNVFSRNYRNGEFTQGGREFNLDNANNTDMDKKGGFYVWIVVASGQTKTLRSDTMPYIVESGFSVAENGALIIEPGTVIKSKDANIYGSFAVPFVVRGTFHAQGTANEPIVFTAFADDSDGYDSDGAAGAPVSGAWENIQFIGATSSDSILEYVNIRYGGRGTNLCPYAYFGGPCMEYKGTVRIQDASPTISHATFDRNLAIAVFIEGVAQPIIEYSDIRNTKEAIKNPRETIGGIGISIGTESLPVLTDNTFVNNNEDVVYRP